MATRCIRCEVLEIPAAEDWAPRRGAKARDLLPWADPYISSLVRRLEERYDAEWADDGFSDPPVRGWEDDAFMPRPVESRCRRRELPVFGGFPLLDDKWSDDAEAD